MPGVKAKILTQRSRKTQVIPTKDDIEQVEQFTYLRVTIDKDGTEDKEIDKRITLANGGYFSMSHVLRFRYINRQIKLEIYRIIIIWIVSDGCEAQVLTAKSKD